jgi:hypothetical protein
VREECSRLGAADYTAIELSQGGKGELLTIRLRNSSRRRGRGWRGGRAVLEPSVEWEQVKKYRAARERPFAAR